MRAALQGCKRACQTTYGEPNTGQVAHRIATEKLNTRQAGSTVAPANPFIPSGTGASVPSSLATLLPAGCSAASVPHGKGCCGHLACGCKQLKRGILTAEDCQKQHLHGRSSPAPAATRSRHGGRPLSPKAGSSVTAEVGMRNSSPARWIGRLGASAGSLKNGSRWTTRRRPCSRREASSWACAK